MGQHTVYLTVTEQTIYRATVDAATPEQAPAEARRLLRDEGWDHAKCIAVVYSEIDRIELEGSPATFCRNCGAQITDPASSHALFRWRSADGQTHCEDGEPHQPGVAP